ncbi:MAG TPA: hypothetical protein PKY77_25325 [Phycisphaerae bacterium]|nr:hypothetical protein [Phycisphaerae bacterium]HRY66777.1 hypothetical protein [Phycisphaerae bacterium]HSA28417.1 hypothetical protein [Phycisphaerae bacterium]
MRSETRKLAWLAFVTVLTAGCGLGCTQAVRVEQADQGERVDVDTLLHEQLQKEPMVTVAEAYRAMVILADGDDAYKSFEERRASLENRGIARAEWNLRREACIDKGSVAYMVCQIIQAPGGANLNLLGRAAHIGDRRYALRELAFLDLLPQTAPYRYITGGELVDLTAKADRYMAAHGRYASEPTDVQKELEAPGSQPARN